MPGEVSCQRDMDALPGVPSALLTPDSTAPPSPYSPFTHRSDLSDSDAELTQTNTDHFSPPNGREIRDTPTPNSSPHTRTKPTCTKAPPSQGLNRYQVDFQEAVLTGNCLELQTLLEERQGKINVNHFDGEGQTALHLSCLEGNLELVKVLVRFGADVRLANRDGWSPVHIACYGGHQQIALYLINAFQR